MNYSSITNNLEFIRNSCRALKRISLEHKQLNANYRKERHEIKKNCVDSTTTTGLFESNPFEVISKKVDDLKILTSPNQVDEIDRINQAASSLDTSSFLYHSNTLKSILSRCESKCHEVMTQLANVDFILNECEDSLETYHMKMVDSMIQYNIELNNLYKRRLSILNGFSESGLIQEGLVGGPSVRMPEFWFQSMTLILNDYDIFRPRDRDVLGYLSDIRYYYNIESMLIESMNLTPSHSSSAQSTPLTLSRSSSPLSMSTNSNIFNMNDCQVPASINSNHRSQVLLFIFEDNPYFSDKTLAKKLYIDKSRLKAGQEMCDGLWITRKEGCKINWYDGRDITKETSNNNNSSHLINVNKTEPKKSCSFFEFFTDDGFNNHQQIERRDGKDVQLDYQIFMLFRDIIVPHAVVAFCREEN